MKKRLLRMLVLAVFARMLCGCEYDYAYTFSFTRTGPMPRLANLARMECFVPPRGYGVETGGVRIPLTVALTFSGTENRMDGVAVIRENGYRTVLQTTGYSIGDVVHCLPPERVEFFGSGLAQARLIGRPANLPPNELYIQPVLVEVHFWLNRERDQTDPFGLNVPGIDIYNLPAPWPPGWGASVDPTRLLPNAP